MQRLLSTLLSILILLSSSGLVFAKHYCGTTEMNSKVTLGETDLNCGKVMASICCEAQPEEKGQFCCNNTYLKVSTDNQYAKVTYDFDFTMPWFVSRVEPFAPRRMEIQTGLETYFKLYRPPILSRDFQILLETFLI